MLFTLAACVSQHSRFSFSSVTAWHGTLAFLNNLPQSNPCPKLLQFLSSALGLELWATAGVILKRKEKVNVLGKKKGRTMQSILVLRCSCSEANITKYSRTDLAQFLRCLPPVRPHQGTSERKPEPKARAKELVLYHGCIPGKVLAGCLLPGLLKGFGKRKGALSLAFPVSLLHLVCTA